MSIISRIEHLRGKPEHVRKRIAFWSSFGITAIIFTFWLASFTSMGAASRSNLAAVASKVESPAQSLVASVGSFFEDLSNMFFTPKKVIYTEVEVSGGSR